MRGRARRATRVTTLTVGIAGILAIAAGFFLGSSVFAGSAPERAVDTPSPITTSEDSTPIPLPSAVEELPALDLPPETSSAESGQLESEGGSSVSPSSSSGAEEKVEEPASSAAQPDITVAPTE